MIEPVVMRRGGVVVAMVVGLELVAKLMKPILLCFLFKGEREREREREREWEGDGSDF